MTQINQKHQILESLDSLDQTQTNKVLDYIKSLLYPVKDEMNYQNFKKEALKEIRQALSKKRRVKSAF
jgi:hypothetical protein